MEGGGTSRPVKVFLEGRQRSMLEQLAGSGCGLKSTLGFARLTDDWCALLSLPVGLDN